MKEAKPGTKAGKSSASTARAKPGGETRVRSARQAVSVAAASTEKTGDDLPFGAAIQERFGHHDGRISEVRRDVDWERSPMPQSGNTISAEEDLSESFSRCLASSRTRAAMQANFPRRYQLISRYLGHLMEAAEQGERAAPSR